MVFLDFQDGCGMATADKCNGIIPPDGTNIPDNLTNLMEVNDKYHTFKQLLSTFDNNMQEIFNSDIETLYTIAN